MQFAPELFLLLGALIIFLFSLFENRRGVRNAALAIGLGAVLLTAASLGRTGLLFMGAYKVDLFSQLFKLLIACGMAAVLIFGRRLPDIDRRLRPEYYLCLILSSLGLMMLVSSVDMIAIFVSLELASFALYLMLPMRDDRQGRRIQMEAAIKYMLLGVMATGVMLFGMSYIFGLTGTTNLAAIAPKLHNLMSEPAALVGIAMIVCVFMFKLAAFPFNFWVADAYEGAANETTAFLATVPKLAAVALLIRVVSLISPVHELTAFLAVMAVCSMFYGNLCALRQTDFKRMMAFSAIAHAGFVLLGILTFRQAGYAAAMYYITGYLVMNLACFLVICQVSKAGENVAIASLAGLYKRSPLLALTMGISMFALAGIPPFVGFMGEFMLLAGALRAGHLTVVILGAVNSAIAIYYYLSVVRVTYCRAPENDAPLQVDLGTRAVSLILIATIIIMGVLPGSFLSIAANALHGIL
ncbi:MAG: NADH-quinone oxidoreductase subunit N [Deltaproteobacteria bacterium]|nr:NADH-quinone oxidoreductase subunit N [Deltaproteobacteria bacterium]